MSRQRKWAVGRALTVVLAFALFPQQVTLSQTENADERRADQANAEALEIPTGTILPVRLNHTLSTKKSRAGDTISGKLMQDVPLPSGQRIQRGGKVMGKILKVTRASGGTKAEISIRFDVLLEGGRTTPLTTNLRAIAGFMEVEAAHIPTLSSGEGEVFDWLPTRQIGGDTVYGAGGPVGKWDDPERIVGKSTGDGVLAQISAREGSECRGAVGGNDAPQAVWVFSSDACGVYGLSRVTVAHAGRTPPLGLVVLRSESGTLSVASGAGILLRVD